MTEFHPCPSCGKQIQGAPLCVECTEEGETMSDERIVERLATEFMEWKQDTWKYCTECIPWKDCNFQIGAWKRVCSEDGNESWNPLTNWNHWRQVEEKVMEDEKLWREFCYGIAPHSEQRDSEFWAMAYMEADLRTRCRALLAALSSLHST